MPLIKLMPQLRNRTQQEENKNRKDIENRAASLLCSLFLLGQVVYKERMDSKDESYKNIWSPREYGDNARKHVNRVP